MDRTVPLNLAIGRSILLKYRDTLLPLGGEDESGNIVQGICRHLDTIRLYCGDLEQVQDSKAKTDVWRAISRAVQWSRSMTQVFREGKCEPKVPGLSEDDDSVDLSDKNIDLDIETASNSSADRVDEDIDRARRLKINSALRTLDAKFGMISDILLLIYFSRK
jgi:hypothetical protein